MGRSHTHRLRVRYGECDPQGVVFNAHYFAYFDIALTELWREAAGGYAGMMDDGIDLQVVEATARYKAPARFDDELDLTIEVTRLGHHEHGHRRSPSAATASCSSRASSRTCSSTPTTLHEDPDPGPAPLRARLTRPRAHRSE